MIAAAITWLLCFIGFLLCCMFEIAAAARFEKPKLVEISFPDAPLYDDLHDNPKKFEEEADQFLNFLYYMTGELNTEARRVNNGVHHEA